MILEARAMGRSGAKRQPWQVYSSVRDQALKVMDHRVFRGRAALRAKAKMKFQHPIIAGLASAPGFLVSWSASDMR